MLPGNMSSLSPHSCVSRQVKQSENVITKSCGSFMWQNLIYLFIPLCLGDFYLQDERIYFISYVIAAEYGELVTIGKICYKFLRGVLTLLIIIIVL